jgi:excinuclease ABC subunit A
VITTQLYFMPDVEVTCGACKGARFNSETLEVTVRGKTIDDVLEHVGRGGRALSSRRAVDQRKIQVLDELGLGYLTLGQSATTLSGGEAQRIKIATELSTLQRSKHTRLHPRRADDRAAPRRRRAAAGVARTGSSTPATPSSSSSITWT